MKTNVKTSIIALAALLVVSLAVCGGLSIPAQAAGSYYVDCSAATNGDGSQSSPWNNLSPVNGTTFVAGDSILFKRGTTCAGMLQPGGSGTAGSPITIGDYGSGALPIIDGGTGNDAAIKLYNQQGWHIENIETTGGKKYGIYIGNGGSSTLSHFRVTDVVVHDVYNTASSKESGLIFIATSWGKSGILEDVIVDGATAYNTQQWNGIRISCTGSMSHPANQPVVIRNSSVNTVHGDGIVIYSCSNGTIEDTVAWDTGNITSDSIGTPNSTWTWSCKDCTVQFNEAYLAASPKNDGGAFDIDYPATNNVYQYNYGHDNESYCAAVFGAEREGTFDSIVRYNICSNNGRDTIASGGGPKFGEFSIFTWNGGWLEGVAIYNNTVYWNPAESGPGADSVASAFCNGCIQGWKPDIRGTDNFFMNNIIYSTSPYLVFNLDTMDLDSNLYWYTGAGDPYFSYGATWETVTTYREFAAYQSGTGQDANSLYADPKLNDPTYHGTGMPTTQFTLQSSSPAINAGADLVTLGLQTSMGTRDFYGNVIPNGAYDIGAHEYGGTPPPTNTPEPTNTPGGPTDTPVPPTDTPEPTNTPAGCFGTTNVALNQPATASSVQGDDVPAYGVDGSLSTRWWTLKGSTNSTEWIQVDLGSVQTVCKARVYQGDRYATAYTIEVSENGSDWTVVDTETGGDRDVWFEHTFDPIAARYVRKQSTAWYSTSDRVKLYEFEVYDSGGPPPPTDTPAPPTDTPVPTDTLIPPTDTPIPPTDTPVPPTDTPEPGPTDTPVPPTDTPIPPTDTPEPPTNTPEPTNTPGSGGNLALNKPTQVSSQQPDQGGDKAVDGSLSTYWRTAKYKNNQLPRPPEWITVDLQSSYTIDQVVLKWNPQDRCATAYTVDVSSNGSDWTTVFTESSGDCGTDTVNFSATSAAHVRLYTTAWTNENEGNYLDELEVYE